MNKHAPKHASISLTAVLIWNGKNAAIIAPISGTGCGSTECAPSQPHQHSVQGGNQSNHNRARPFPVIRDAKCALDQTCDVWSYGRQVRRGTVGLAVWIHEATRFGQGDGRVEHLNVAFQDQPESQMIAIRTAKARIKISR
jgi:hypothetical protein